MLAANLAVVLGAGGNDRMPKQHNGIRTEYYPKSQLPPTRPHTERVCASIYGVFGRQAWDPFARLRAFVLNASPELDDIMTYNEERRAQAGIVSTIVLWF